MKLIDDPDERFWYPPAACFGCGTDLAAAPVTAQRRHQVTDIEPALALKVTEYVAQAKECPCCGTVTEGELPPQVRARAGYGPETHVQHAKLTCGHHIPVWRSTLLLCQLAGIAVSTGWMAGIRGKAAALVGASGFMDRVRELLKTAPALHADETPARAAGGTRYVHLPCTRYLTCMHTGDRSAEAIDAGGVLPGYQGIIVRDGYAGYGHLADALHAWCAAHLLRDLKGLYDFEPASRTGIARWPPCSPGPATPRPPPATAVSPSWIPGRPGHPLPGDRHRRASREPVPAYRDREGRPPHRPPVPRLRGPDPPFRLAAWTWTSSPTTKPSARSGR